MTGRRKDNRFAGVKGRAIALSLLLAVALVPGCGTEKAEPAAKEEAAAETAETAAEEDTAAQEDVAADELSAEAADALQFTTVDLDGNAVDSAELFGAHEYTMLNLWTTWCPYCIQEFPDLAVLSEEFAEKDCAIIGVLLDADNEEKIAEGKALLEEGGVPYANLVPWDGIADDFSVPGVPTSFFVDRNGNLVGEPVVGADLAAYFAQIEELLG